MFVPVSAHRHPPRRLADMQLGAEFNLFSRISAGREAGESGRPGRFGTARGRVGGVLRWGAWDFGDALEMVDE